MKKRLISLSWKIKELISISKMDTSQLCRKIDKKIQGERRIFSALSSKIWILKREIFHITMKFYLRSSLCNKKIVTVEELGNSVNLFVLLFYKNLMSRKKLSSSRKTERKDKVETRQTYSLYWHPGWICATRQIRPRNCSSILGSDSSRGAGHRDKDLRSMSANSQQSSV